MAFAYPTKYLPSVDLAADVADMKYAAMRHQLAGACPVHTWLRPQEQRSRVCQFNGDRHLYKDWRAGFMAKIAQNPTQFKSEESKLRFLMSNVTGLAFDVLDTAYGNEAREEAQPGTLRLEDALNELEFTFRCFEHEDATKQLLKLRMGKDQLFADFFPQFMALVNRGARTCHGKGTCENIDRSKKLALQACLPARFGDVVKKYVTEDHGSFKEFVDECFASEGWTRSPDPTMAETTMDGDEIVTIHPATPVHFGSIPVPV